MSKPNAVDAAALNLMLSELRLPSIKSLWPRLTEQADREGWPASRLLAVLTEHEIADRSRRRFQRRLREAHLPGGKTLESFEFAAVPMVSKAHVMALSAGDRWLDEGANLILIGPPGAGKSHLAAAIGLALIENGYRVLFTRTTDLTQRLQMARRELALEAAIAKLDKFHLVVLDLSRPCDYPDAGKRWSWAALWRRTQQPVTVQRVGIITDLQGRRVADRADGTGHLSSWVASFSRAPAL